MRDKESPHESPRRISRLESSSSSEASTAGPRRPRFAELPKLRSGSFGVLTVSFFASVITVKEVDNLSLGVWTVTQSMSPESILRYSWCVVRRKMDVTIREEKRVIPG